MAIVLIVPSFERDTPRFTKGLALARAGRVVRRGDVWVVASESHRNVRYTVRHTLGTAWRCSCPDFDLRDAPCKHMIAAFLTIMPALTPGVETVLMVPGENAKDEEDDEELPGLTVAALRKALAGVAGHLPVTVRATGEGDATCGGIVSAAIEDNCGGTHFAINFSDNLEDFE